VGAFAPGTFLPHAKKAARHSRDEQVRTRAVGDGREAGRDPGGAIEELLDGIYYLTRQVAKLEDMRARVTP
jgi:hypothetical protein